MRLIDADALVERIVSLTCVPCRENGNDYKGVKCRSCQYGDEIDDIESAPTVEERKTGKWIPLDIPWYQCSECGAVRKHVLSEWALTSMWKYCPNCGSIMEEDHEDD